MPEAPLIFLIHSGTVGKRAFALLAGLNVAVGARQLEAFDGSLPRCGAVALVTDRPYPAVERTLATACWDGGVPFITSVLLAHRLRVGPAFVPGRTPCFSCWSRRVRSVVPNLEVHEAVEQSASRGPAGSWLAGELPVLTEQVAAQVAAEAISLSTQTYSYPPRRMGRFWTGDAIFGGLESHFFARVGACPRCSPRGRAGDGAVTLQEHSAAGRERGTEAEREH